MKTRKCSLFFLLTLISCAFFSTISFAQKIPYRGAPYRYSRPYHMHYYPYPVYSHAHAYISIPYGGYVYHYHQGCFYRPYGSVYQLVPPPFGITISTLPYGYFGFYLGLNPYYYFNGIFYKPHADQYEVVAPPLGAVVNKLPSGAKVRVIDGQKYYEQNGTFYKEEYDQNNKLSYRVVGTDGVLNTNPDNTEENTTDTQRGS